MRIFVTGATGFVGSAVVSELIQSGHSVLGLARSDASASMLAAQGVDVLRGSLEDTEALRRGVESTDGVIHTAFNHNFSKMVENGEVERKAIAAMGEVLQGTARPIMITSGLAMVSQGELAVEQTTTNSALALPRTPEISAALLSELGVYTMVLRLPPTVHGQGDHGFVPILIQLAREKGVAAFIENGNNRWPAVHRLDAAHLYRLALEKGTPGAIYHAVGEEGIPFREIAGMIGRHLNLPVRSLQGEAVSEYFGWFSLFAGIDSPASSVWTQRELGWNAKQIGLLADMEQSGYFSAK